MAVKIRLKRLGKIRSPHYRIVVADSRTKRDGRAIEEIGKYHPKNDPSVIEVDSERAQYWLSVGAQPSDRVARFLDAAGVRERAVRQNLKKGEPGDKAKERAEERATREAEAAEAATAAAEAPAEEAPAEAPAAEEAPAEAPVAEEAPAEAPAAEEAAGGGDGEATPADEAPNKAESPVDPAEGAEDSGPAEGAEKAE